MIKHINQPKSSVTSRAEIPSLEAQFKKTFADIQVASKEFKMQLGLREVGNVIHNANGIAIVSGLPNVGYDELVRFSNGLLGIAFNIDEVTAGIVLLGHYWHLRAGDEVLRTGRVMDVPVGEHLLGRVINPLGEPLDGIAPPKAKTRLPIERPATAIMDRAPVTTPLQTGIKVIDALIPIGLGQRELILGDRQTGKTALAIDTIVNQRGKDVLCVYCAIGQRGSSVAKVIATLRQHNALDYTVVVVAAGDAPPGLSYIAPYAATSIAEAFIEAGRDVLIVYDDLTQHARAYRELSLLLKRPPGREAFPGDIFYLHSRLLERATHLSKELGGGSLTALPIIETEAQDISAYIPTNLISITDGQIYLSPALFELGILPAVDVGKSVSRVGGKAQRKAYRSVASNLKLTYAQFEELESFSRFGARVDQATEKIIAHGQRVRMSLKQAECSPVSLSEQILLLLAVKEGLFDTVPLLAMSEAEQHLLKAASDIPQGIRDKIESDESISDDDGEMILKLASNALAEFGTDKTDEKETLESSSDRTMVTSIATNKEQEPTDEVPAVELSTKATKNISETSE
ncbi:alternate F1F0 ATPase, F1 subunit alpha [Simiduia litorea]|uniref:alternate F1F0 ATPase, F1 subunit alpha n=1 Tax=Simiduia litorea TaxID=1435348 RepID=UPI0036F2F887